MKLDEGVWIHSGGLTPDWRRVAGHRLALALSGLEAITRELGSRAPAPVRARGYDRGLRYLLVTRGVERDRLLLHPAFDYWLFLWDKHFGAPCPEENWHLQFGLVQAFAAVLALQRGGSLELSAVADPDGHLHLYGLPVQIEFPAALSGAPLELSVSKKGLRLRAEGVDTLLPRKLLLRGEAGTRRAGGVLLRRCESITPDMAVQSCGLLMTQAVTMHGLAAPTDAENAAFARVLRTALAHIDERDPAFGAELRDMLAVLVPLKNSMDHGSVSSSYVNLRGCICLSHSEDPLLQAETLIHEFCHQKMNQLLLVEPLLLPGQGGQVFYSPWRKDARRLRGLILGAHAFLNVASYLIKSLSRETYPLLARVSVMTNVARRLYEVEDALRTIAAYSECTPFGAAFVLGMWRELQALFHAVQWFPPELLEEARKACAAHRAAHALPGTGFHRAEGFASAVSLFRYKAPAAGPEGR